MNMKKFLGKATHGYSLLELIATVTVLVALATVMLPSVTVNKRTIYNTTEVYNMSGTQRYLEMFNSLYKATDGTIGAFNCYPNAFSTGFTKPTGPAVPATATAAAGRLSLDTIALLSNQTLATVDPGKANVDQNGDTTVITVGNLNVTAAGANPAVIVDPMPLTIANAISLFKAGITTLNYGSGGNRDFTTAANAGAGALALVPTPVADTTIAYGANPTLVIKYCAGVSAATLAPATINALFGGTYINQTTLAADTPPILINGLTPVTLQGYTAPNWFNLCNNAADDLVFLFVTPNMNWTTYYADAKYVAAAPNLTFSHQIVKPSAVSVPVPATSPWMPVDSYRYYIAVFDVDAGVTTPSLTAWATVADDPITLAELKGIQPAKLIGILSPSNLSTATP